VSTLDACQDIAAWIEETIVDDPPISVREGGLIKPGCDAKLDQLREASVSGKQWIAELERQERERTGIKSLKIGFNKVFGYYIEVTRANLGALPEGIYERKQTLANAERFITPELKEKEALILEAEEKMVDIEYELFTRLRERIAAETGRLQKLAETIAEIDALQSLAAVSAERRYRRPTITDGYDLTIEAGRHPVVEALLGSEPFIANDTVLSEQDCRMMLITGPNMAGKSTYMRQVAYILIMAQIGCFVPAERAVIPIVDRIFTRIGAADDVIGGQSTFMVEMKDIQLMTAKATQRSLVIIDELGRGTSTGEGMAIAQSVIEFIHHHIGCKTLVSTHFHELAHLEDSLAYLRNYCMDVKESGEEVTFLRKLIRGAASTSYGIYCAKIAGIPETIIERAYQILSTLEIRTTELQSAVSLAQPVQLSLFPDIPLADRRSSDDPCQAREKKRNNDQSKVEKRTSEGDDEGAHTSLDSAATLRSHEPMDTLTASEPAAASVPASAQEIYKRVHEADLMNMTPLQAMQFILELKSIK
jgi:DNA mismatch repair protein MutS